MIREVELPCPFQPQIGQIITIPAVGRVVAVRLLPLERSGENILVTLEMGRSEDRLSQIVDYKNSYNSTQLQGVTSFPGG